MLDLAPGDNRSALRLTMRRVRVYTLKVSAIDQAGDPVPTAALDIRSKSETFSGGLVSALAPVRSTTGVFEFPRLTPGEYIIQARPGPQRLNTDGTNPPAPPLYGRLEIAVTDRDIDDAVIRLLPNVEITATVTVVDGDPESFPRGPTAPALGLIEPEIPGMNNRGGRMSDDGVYRIESVARSLYGVALTAPAGMYVKSIRFGGVDITHSPLDLRNGAGGQIDIVVSGRAADVSGTVRDKEGRTLSAVSVVLWPRIPDTSNLSGGARSATTDPNGAFRFESLAPGEYYLAAWDGISTGQADGPDFHNQYTGQAAAIKIDEGAHVTRDIEPISPR
jgi:hypothetical protein